MAHIWPGPDRGRFWNVKFPISGRCATSSDLRGTIFPSTSIILVAAKCKHTVDHSYCDSWSLVVAADVATIWLDGTLSNVIPDLRWSIILTCTINAFASNDPRDRHMWLPTFQRHLRPPDAFGTSRTKRLEPPSICALALSVRSSSRDQCVLRRSYTHG